MHAQQQLAMLPGMGMAAPMSLAAQGPFHPIAAVAAAAVGMGTKPEEKNDDRNSNRTSRPRSSTPETSQKRVKVIFKLILLSTYNSDSENLKKYHWFI